MSIPAQLQVLTERWATASPAERANAQLYLVELCRALDVEPPRPAGSGYEFEYSVRVGKAPAGRERESRGAAIGRRIRIAR